MEVISFFESSRQAHWLEQLRACDWGTGEFLHELLTQGTFFDAVGLYEKYGFAYLTQMDDMDGNPSRVYVKRITALPLRREQPWRKTKT